MMPKFFDLIDAPYQHWFDFTYWGNGWFKLPTLRVAVPGYVLWIN